MRLLETLRAEDGEIALLDRHLARLSASARALGFPMDEAEVRRRLAEVEREGRRRLRLTLGPTGQLRVESEPLPDARPQTVWIDPEPLAEAGTVLCAHKTTARRHYRARLARARARGADEAALVNARGEITEGTFTNVWAEIGGRLWTPPLASGGLGGVMRAHVLATAPRAGERPLLPADLASADALYLSNALRGWMPVSLLAHAGA